MGYLLSEFRPRTQIVKNENKQVITEAEGIADVRKQYCEKLYEDHDGIAKPEGTNYWKITQYIKGWGTESHQNAKKH